MSPERFVKGESERTKNAVKMRLFTPCYYFLLCLINVYITL